MVCSSFSARPIHGSGRIAFTQSANDGMKPSSSLTRCWLSWWTRQDLRNLFSVIFTTAAVWNLWDGRWTFRRR
jgi:hypothetical protein